MYDTFDLKFTLLSVDGSSSPGAGGVLSVGAVINRTDSASDDMYAPNVVRLAEGYDPYFQETFYRTNISSTTYWTDVIYVVGFCAYQAEYYRYGGWNPSGNNLTLLVEPAPGAVQIVPEPTTLLLLGLGGLTVLRKQRPQPH
jgi:hypothetical protein